MSVSHGPLVGDVDDQSAVVWARSHRAGVVVFRWWADDAPSVPHEVRIDADPTRDHTARAVLTGLTANRAHTVEVDGPTGPLRARFRTLADAHRPPLTLLFGSCIGGQGFGRPLGGEWTIFRTMAEHDDAALFLMLGDGIYADDAIPLQGNPHQPGAAYHPGAERPCTDLPSLHARYRHHLEDPAWSTFLRAQAVWAIWDDHEVTDDWGPAFAAESCGVEFEAAAKAAFYDYWPIRPQSPPRIHRSVRHGELAELFFLDVRSHRARHALPDPVTAARRGPGRDGPAMSTLLGAAQRAWIADAVAASSATWKLVVCSVPVSWPTGTGENGMGPDGWSDPGAAEELEGLARRWAEAGVTNLVFLTGDTHHPSSLRYTPPRLPTLPDGRPFVFHELAAGPLAALPLPPAARPDSPALGPEVLFAEGTMNGGLHCFGRLDLTRRGLRFQVIDAWGLVRHRLELPSLITVRGKALDAASGAVVECDDGAVLYLGGMDCWPGPVFGQRVVVSGHLVVAKLAPDPVVGADGGISHGMFGSSTVLHDPRWRLEGS